MDSGSVRFTSSSSGQAAYSKPVKKVTNFFDEDDSFETFDDDADFEKMAISLNENHFGRQEADSGDLGRSWGGTAYSLKEESSARVSSTQPVHKTSHQNSKESSARVSSTQPVLKTSHQILKPEIKPSLRGKLVTESTETTQSHFVKTTGKDRTTSSFSAVSHETFAQTSSTSIENVVEVNKSQMNDAEKNRLIAEVKQLKKENLVLRQSNRKTPKPTETVKKLVLNEPCVLEIFRSLDDKLGLLDEAIKIGDGNALITVLLFIKKTVKYKIFEREISRRPVAVRHIVSFMKAHYEYDDLIKLLRHLGRNEEAMMLLYKKALSVCNPDARLEVIHACERSYNNVQELTDVVSILKEHQRLIKRQIQIETKDKRTQAEGKDPVMNQHPRPRVVLTPIISTLEYCCLYHYGKGDDTLDPLSIRKDFKLSEKQYEWTVIGARAKLKKWADLHGLFTAKGWFGSNKLKSSLGFEKVVAILQKSNAPPDILIQYLELVEPPETRLSLATQLHCHKVAVETIVNMKDKQKLISYRNNIDSFHPVQSLISSYLQNSQIKWK